MVTLGYVVAKGNMKNKVDYVSYIENIDERTDDKPCLVIGLSEARKIASDNFSILNKTIDDNTFWTFGRTEKREEYEEDLNKFYSSIFLKHIENVRYRYLNILTLNFNILKRLYKLFNSLEKKYIYIWNDMIYILCDDNTVVGISLKIAKYCKCDVNKVISKITRNKNNIIKFDDKFLDSKIRSKIRNRHYIIPYLMSIME